MSEKKDSVLGNPSPGPLVAFQSPPPGPLTEAFGRNGMGQPLDLATFDDPILTPVARQGVEETTDE